MKYNFYGIAFFFLCSSLPIAAQNSIEPIGIVISAPGGSALETPNVTITSREWQSVANAGQNAATDAEGWPVEDFRALFLDHRPFNAWNNDCDDPERYGVDVSGLYSLSFEGQATITSWCDAPIQILNKTYHAVTNTTTADILFPPGGGPNADAWELRLFDAQFFANCL